MNASEPLMPTPTTPVSRGPSAGRVAAVVTGGLAALLALLVLSSGAALLWGDSQKDHDGYLSTKNDRFHTRTYALATDNLDVDTDGASRVLSHDMFGTVRVKAHSNDGKPVFIGIARTKDVDRYLRGTAHARVTDVDTSPFRASYRQSAGEGRPGVPADQSIWAAQAGGTGTRTLAWDVEDGDWSVVVMNADASAGVDAGVSAGARLPWLDEAGWVALGGGTLIAIVAGVLIVAGVRPPRGGYRPAAVAPAAAA
jgi:hypothetical protein